MARYGMTIPLGGIPLHEHEDWLKEMVDLGYTDFWSAESNAHDGFTPLALASAWTPTARLGVAIIPAFTRGPALMAQSVASLADAAPGRFVMGIGTSSDVIVERWNGIPFEQPYQQVRDMVRFLRKALTGEKVDESYERFTVKGFRSGVKLPESPPILIAALREGMLRLAGREGDGAILNWLSAEDVKQVVPHVHAGGEGKEIAARIFVLPIANREVALAIGRRAVAAYLNVPVYAAFHEWLGRGDVLASMWKHWKEGDRNAALEAIPEEVVDALIVNGPPEACREHIERYVENGVDTPALALIHTDDLKQSIRELAPR
ncbi:MAG: LLM class F420-dependent oxidoreductase [Myxococcota bacterium]|nr:LLM class F420-dependent oxidoreductase [Myxococcota bacterium]